MLCRRYSGRAGGDYDEANELIGYIRGMARL